MFAKNICETSCEFEYLGEIPLFSVKEYESGVLFKEKSK
jgi:hypothetical protein